MLVLESPYVLFSPLIYYLIYADYHIIKSEKTYQVSDYQIWYKWTIYSIIYILFTD